MVDIAERQEVAEAEELRVSNTKGSKIANQDGSPYVQLSGRGDPEHRHERGRFLSRGVTAGYQKR